MNEIKILGTININGFEIKDIEGGFGEGKKAILVKDLAIIHNQPLGELNRRINENSSRFKENIDIIDLKIAMAKNHSEINYTTNGWNASKNVYILSERGYSKLLKILEDDLAWEIYDKFVDEYFTMRKELQEIKLPTTYKEALKELLAKVEENERLELENKQKEQLINELKPKASYTDVVLNSPSLVSVTQIAKDFGLTSQQLNNILAEEEIQYKQGKQWLLYAKYSVMGYTQSSTVEKNNFTFLYTKWTQKGRLFIYELLKKRNILPIVEREENN